MENKIKDDYTQKISTRKALEERVKSCGWGGVKILRTKCPKYNCSCKELRLLEPDGTDGPTCCADLWGYYPKKG